MKKHIFETKKTKLIARVMLIVLLLASALSFAGCIFVPIVPSDWEVYSHKEFIEKIEQYNSINNGSIDTFISFDFDDNENITKKIYYFWTDVSDRFGIYDILDHYYDIDLIFYLKDQDHLYYYKIHYNYNRNHTQNNFTEQDKIEIVKFDNHHCVVQNDCYYDESIEDHSNEEVIMYNHYYKCGIYVNGARIGCIHISSIDETSEEKLDEIIQMMSDSLVVINADGFFVWREDE